MILGMTYLVFVHVVISLIGIVTGFVVAYGLLKNQRLPQWTGWFLATTILTSVSGFFLPADRILPAHIIGVLSLIVLAASVYGLYVKRLAGNWRVIYIVTALVAQYFNVFVLVAQAFNKVPFLRSLAPTQSEPPFAIAQLVVLVLFGILTFRAVKRFQPANLVMA